MDEFDRALIATSPGARIGLVLCADHDHASINAEHGRAHFARLGADARALVVKHSVGATELAEEIDFDIVYIAGGDPRALVHCLQSALGAHLLRAWQRGVTLAGSSAGAMALAVHCLLPQAGDDKPTTWGEGMGPLRGVGLAVHASERPQRWLRNISQGAPVPVLALDNATGVLLAHGSEPRVIGPGDARILHAS